MEDKVYKNKHQNTFWNFGNILNSCTNFELYAIIYELSGDVQRNILLFTESLISSGKNEDICFCNTKFLKIFIFEP